MTCIKCGEESEAEMCEECLKRHLFWKAPSRDLRTEPSDWRPEGWRGDEPPMERKVGY